VTLTGQIATVIRAHGAKGIVTTDLAREVGATRGTVHGVLVRLLRGGWVRREAQRIYVNGRGRGVTAWVPTSKLCEQPYPGAYYLDTPARVLALVTDAGITTHQLAEEIGRPLPTIQAAVRRLLAAGKVEASWRMTGRVHRYVLRPPLEDDGWQPPAQYVGGTRAKILGMGRAA
jgi:predicted transcriptional regulator